MDVLKFLKEGNVRANPDYNPKTKKGRLEPPTLVDYNPGTSVRDIGISNIAANRARGIYDLNKYNNSNYEDYDVFVNPVDTEEELNKERALNQSNWEQARNAVVQAVGSEIVLGTLRGFSDIGDAAIEGLKWAKNKATGEEGEPNDYTNAVSFKIEEWQNQLRERFDIYRENPNETNDFGDFAWWASNFPSVASTFSLLIPSTGIAKGASLLGKAVGYGTKFSRLSTKAAQVLSKAGGKYSKALRNEHALANALSVGGEQVGMATLMRTAENYMEAKATYDTVKDNALNALDSMDDKQFEEFVARNPEYQGKEKEEIANRIAGESADETFKNDFALVAMDFIQLRALRNFWKNGVNKPVSAELMAKQNASLKGLTKEGAEQLAKETSGVRGVLNKVGNNFKKLNSTAVAELGEGFEEAYQYGVQESSVDNAHALLDPTFDKRDISDYLKSGELWESAFWGWLGGLAFQGLGSGAGLLAKRLSDKNALSEEKVRGMEIENRVKIFDRFADNINLINQGKSVEDIDTNNPNNYDSSTGELIRRDLTPEEIEVAKQNEVDKLISEIGIGAIRAGNFDLLKDYVKDPILNKYLVERGAFGEEKESATVMQHVQQRLEELGEIYAKHAYNIEQVRNLNNPIINSFIAENNVRTELASNRLQKDINEETTAINKIVTDNKIDNIANVEQYWFAIQDVVDFEFLTNQLRQFEELNKAGAIDNRTLKYRKDSLNRYIKLFADKYGIPNNDISAIEAKINEIVLNNKTAANNIAKNHKVLNDKLAKRVELNNKKLFNDINIAKTDEEYKSQYRIAENAMYDTLANKTKEAIDTVTDIMERNDHDEVMAYINDEAQPTNLSEQDVKRLTDAKLVLDLNNVDNEKLYKDLKLRYAQVRDSKIEANRKDVKVNGEPVPTKTVTDTTGEEVEVTPFDSLENNEAEIEDEANPDSAIPPVEEGIPEPVKVGEVANTSKTTTVEEEANGAIPGENPNPQPTSMDEQVAAALDKSYDEIYADPTIAANAAAQKLVSNNIEEFASNDEAMIDIIYNEIVTDGNENAAKDAAIKAYNTWKKLAIKRLKNLGKLSDINGEVPSQEAIDAFKDIISEYITTKGIKIPKRGKPTINIFDFFNYLLNDYASADGTPNTQIIYTIYNNIYDIINQLNDTYRFTNKNFLVKNAAQQFLNTLANLDKILIQEERNMRININTIFADAEERANFNRLLNNLEPGTAINVRPVQNQSKEGISKVVELYVINPNGTETKLGMLNVGIVEGNGNTQYGFKWFGITTRITKDSTAYHNTIIDPFMNELYSDSDEGIQLLEDVREYYDTGSDESIHYILANPVANRFFAGDEIGLIKAKLNYLRGIINYNKGTGNTQEEYRQSYQDYLKKTYDNYVASEALYNNPDKVVRVSHINKGNPIEGRDFVPVSEAIANIENIKFGYIGQDYSIHFDGGDNVSQEYGFSYGQVFAAIPNGNSAPTYVRLRGNFVAQSNPIVSSGLANSINEIFHNRFDNGITNDTFDDIRSKLMSLFGSTSKYRTNLFDRFVVIEQGNGMLGLKHVNENKPSIVIYRNRNNSKALSNAIAFVKDGVNHTISKRNDNYYLSIGKTTTQITLDEVNNYIKEFTDYLTNNAIFAQPFGLFDTMSKGFPNGKVNDFVEIRNGKFVTKFAMFGGEQTFDSYQDFIVQTNGFITNQISKVGNSNYLPIKVNKEGKAYVDSNVNIGIEILNEVRGETAPIIQEGTDKLSTYEKAVKGRNNTKAKKLLLASGLNNVTINELDSLGLIPKNVSYDAKLQSFGRTTVENGTPKITIGRRLLEHAARTNPTEIQRVLMHERLHEILINKDRTGKALETYQAELQSIFDEFKDSLESFDKNSADYNYLSQFLYGETYLERNPQYRGNQLAILEEFLVESFTNKQLANHLNNVQSKVKVDNKELTLFQRILKFLAEFLGGISDIKSNSLLERELYAVSVQLQDENANQTEQAEQDITQPPVEEGNSQAEQSTVPQEQTDVDEANDSVNDEPHIDFDVAGNIGFGNTFDTSDIDEVSDISGVMSDTTNYGSVSDLLTDIGLTEQAEQAAFLADGSVKIYC